MEDFQIFEQEISEEHKITRIRQRNYYNRVYGPLLAIVSTIETFRQSYLFKEDESELHFNYPGDAIISVLPRESF